CHGLGLGVLPISPTLVGSSIGRRSSSSDRIRTDAVSPAPYGDGITHREQPVNTMVGRRLAALTRVTRPWVQSLGNEVVGRAPRQRSRGFQPTALRWVFVAQPTAPD